MNQFYAIYLHMYSLLLYTLLTLLDMSGHEYLSLPPHSDEGLQVGFAEAPLPAEAMSNQVTGIDPPPEGL